MKPTTSRLVLIASEIPSTIVCQKNINPYDDASEHGIFKI